MLSFTCPIATMTSRALTPYARGSITTASSSGYHSSLSGASSNTSESKNPGMPTFKLSGRPSWNRADSAICSRSTASADSSVWLSGASL